MKSLMTGVFAALCTALAGCSSIVADRISHQQSFDYREFVTSEQLEREGFSEHRYCSVQHGLCLSYLTAQAMPEAQVFRFDRMIRGDAIRTRVAAHERPPGGQGTAVLLHGFAISKEFMAMTASYFRFLGYDVIVPDLLGHGESGGAIAFGVKDAQLLDELLDQKGSLRQPLLVFGNSMGAVAATHLAHLREDIDGLILQAPMLPFDTAAYHYIRFDSPFLARLVTEGSIRKGARKALQRVPVPLAETDIRPDLQALDVPVLILASSADTVAPYGYFTGLEQEDVSVAQIHGRNHYSMVVIDQEGSDYILPWLRRWFGNAEANQPAIGDDAGPASP